MNGYNACFLWGSSHIPWRRETRSIISINSIMVSAHIVSSFKDHMNGRYEHTVGLQGRFYKDMNFEMEQSYYGSEQVYLYPPAIQVQKMPP
ncbi:hypothetical protein C5167_023834 [Papaver somniferum]|uniref:Uncharacterized protein n=1 Tax=Papaver somniferum TaxID=3469 RepID=A0A4Y7JQR5_PAPSO|nr:hypothetical protein C5167_023834 [Papaver somniferum]